MALGGLVTVLHACLDLKSTILGKYHYILYIIVLAMQVCFSSQLPQNLSMQ
jgi:26S proteasome regulatory subunit N1